MPRTRLFNTLILCGAALTGGAATIVVTASAVAGCSDDDTAPGLQDMSQAIIDAAIPHDLAHDQYPSID
jgi:hypothetical protein